MRGRGEGTARGRESEHNPGSCLETTEGVGAPCKYIGTSSLMRECVLPFPTRHIARDDSTRSVSEER